jgi:hypothetical protein
MLHVDRRSQFTLPHLGDTSRGAEALDSQACGDVRLCVCMNVHGACPVALLKQSRRPPPVVAASPSPAAAPAPIPSPPAPTAITPAPAPPPAPTHIAHGKGRRRVIKLSALRVRSRRRHATEAPHKGV